MRAALRTIQQTLTAEAAAVLSEAIEEAARRLHGQTTPLHVAAALLASPSSLLRQACVRSDSHSSHPLQCRALELCFSVALDRLPSSSSPSNSGSSSSSATEPPISNALLAALKRAQAHQRRGFPEQQHQPLLAVKVELEQLVLSILDDPSVSRVMREASFSSPSVKARIEQSLSISTPSSSSNNSISQIPFLFPSPSPSASSIGGIKPNLNPDEVKRVLDIMARGQKRNPVLVGDSDPWPILRDVLRRIESGADTLVPSQLRGAQVISLAKDLADRSQISARIRELGALIEDRDGEAGVVLDLGDLKWLVEGPGSAQHQLPVVVSETGRSAVVEMARLISRFNHGGSHRMWLVGLATCATYLRCQVYYPSLEDNWDLQAAPIAPRSLLPHLFPSLEANGILGTSKDPLPPVKSFPAATAGKFAPPLDSSDSSQKSSLCSLCMEDYRRDLAKHVSIKFERSSSTPKPETRYPLPSWLQIAKEQEHYSQPKKQELNWKHSSEDLLKRWEESCSKLHPGKPAVLPVAQTFPLPPKSNIPGAIPTLHISSLERAASPPGSPVKTDRVLGQSNASSTTAYEQDKAAPGIAQVVDSFKRLFHGLTERVGWQPEAASAIATAVVQCKSGNGKPRPISSKGATWLLFDGSDKVGKRKMAAALSELMFGTTPITVRLAGPSTYYGDSDAVLRGRTSMDRVAEALSRNPFSVIVIENVNSANTMYKSILKSAMERGRLADSHGREVSLESAIFVLITDVLTLQDQNLKTTIIDPSLVHYEEKTLESAANGWLLEFAIIESVVKRHSEWPCNDERSIKKSRGSPTGLISLDLNLATSTEDENEGSRNSSDITVEHDQENGHERSAINKLAAPTANSPPQWALTELRTLVDEMVVFRPVDFISLKRKVTEFIRSKFNVIIGHEHSIRVEEDAVEKIMAGLWLAGAGAQCNGLEEWADEMLVPCIHQLKTCLKATAGPVTVKLIAKKVMRDVGRDLLPAGLSTSVTVKGT